MKAYIDQKMIPLGKIEGELVKASNLIHPVLPGETVLTFGKYTGYSLEYVNKFDHSYIVYLSLINRFGNKVTQEVVDKAKSFTTEEEREDKKDGKEYFRKKCKEVKWLSDFLKGVIRDRNSWCRFAYSIYNRLQSQHQLNLITINQLRCVANMWAEIKSGGKEGKEYTKHREEFKRKMKPYWKRKYDKIEEV